MDLNHVRALAGLPAKPLAIAAPIAEEAKLPEATVIREEETKPVEKLSEEQLNEGKKSSCDRIFGEVMSTLGKSASQMSATAKKAIKDAISDAYEDGHEAGYEEGSQQ